MFFQTNQSRVPGFFHQLFHLPRFFYDLQVRLHGDVRSIGFNAFGSNVFDIVLGAFVLLQLLGIRYTNQLRNPLQHQRLGFDLVRSPDQDSLLRWFVDAGLIRGTCIPNTFAKALLNVNVSEHDSTNAFYRRHIAISLHSMHVVGQRSIDGFVNHTITQLVFGLITKFHEHLLQLLRGKMLMTRDAEERDTAFVDVNYTRFRGMNMEVGVGQSGNGMETIDHGYSVLIPEVMIAGNHHHMNTEFQNPDHEIDG